MMNKITFKKVFTLFIISFLTCSSFLTMFNFYNRNGNDEKFNHPITLYVQNTPTITVNTPSGNYYNSAPTMDVDFDDNNTLDDAYYQVDSYTPTGTNTTNWTTIFTDLGINSYTSDFVIASSVWTALNEGSHNVYFKVWDNSSNINDGVSPSWQFYKDTNPPITATIDSPSMGDDVGGTVTLNASATDNVGGSGVAFVEFWLDGTGTGTLIGTDFWAAYSQTWDSTTTTDGSHNLTVRVYDFAGNYLESAATSITVDNTDPTIAVITVPYNNACLGSVTFIDTSVGDNVGGSGVAFVEFWLDGTGTGTLIGTGGGLLTWDTKTTTDGPHDLYIRVYDFAGNYLDSAAVNVFIDNLDPPTAVITNPSTGDNVSGTINVDANASDNVGGSGVDHVKFWLDHIDGTWIGSDSNAPYSHSWDTTTAGDGSHDLIIQVIDSASNYLDSSEVTVTVDNNNPSIAITEPSFDGADVFPMAGYIWLNGTVSDLTTTIANIICNNSDFTLIVSPIGLSSGAFAFRNNTAVTGTVRVNVTAWDEAGNYDSATRFFNIPVPVPTVSITTPSDGAVLSGSAFWINGTATAGGTRVFLDVVINNTAYFTNLTNLIGLNAGTFHFFNYTALPDGTHVINVTAINDLNQRSLDIVTFTVDNTAPITATITSPTGGASVGGTISIDANAFDNVGGSGVDYVEFWLDGAGVTLIGTDNVAPYSQSWDTTLTTNGLHELTVRVYDFAGNYFDSAATSVTVDNTEPITATITSPNTGDNVSGSISISATAADDVGGSGVDYVEFWDGPIGPGTLLGTDNTAAYSINWDTTTTGDGSHDLYIRVYDNAGNYLESSGVTVTVDNNNPSIAITEPSSDGANVFPMAGYIWLNGTVSDLTTTIANIICNNSDFTLIVSPIGLSSGSFAFRNNTAVTGTVRVNVTAWDEAGNYDSATRFFNIVQIPTPIVSITTPSMGAFLSGSRIWINGTVSAGGSQTITNMIINSPSFMNLTNLVGQNSGTFHYYNNTFLPDSNYTINVTAINDLGQSDFDVVSFTIDNTPPSDFLVIGSLGIFYDTTPEIICQISISGAGINRSSVQFAYSTTGSLTPDNWASVDGVFLDAACTNPASDGDTGTLYMKVNVVPFNQLSLTQNTIRFRVADLAGNEAVQSSAIIIQIAEEEAPDNTLIIIIIVIAIGAIAAVGITYRVRSTRVRKKKIHNYIDLAKTDEISIRDIVRATYINEDRVSSILNNLIKQNEIRGTVLGGVFTRKRIKPPIPVVTEEVPPKPEIFPEGVPKGVEVGREFDYIKLNVLNTCLANVETYLQSGEVTKEEYNEIKSKLMSQKQELEKKMEFLTKDLHLVAADIHNIMDKLPISPEDKSIILNEIAGLPAEEGKALLEKYKKLLESDKYNGGEINQ